MAKAKAKKPTPKKPVKKAAKPAAKKAAPKKAAKSAAKKTSKPAAKKVVKPAAKKVSKPAAKKSAPKKAAKKVVKLVAKKVAKVKPQPKKVAKKVVKKAVKKVVKKATPAPKKAVAKAKPVTKSVSGKGKKARAIPGGGNVVVDHTHDSIVRYSDDDLMMFKKLIDGKLVGAREELNNLKDSLSNFTESQSGNKAWNMEEGTDTSEMEYLMNQISRQNKHIRDLEMALVRIENKTYGICRVTGSLIPKERLRVVPHATLSIEAKNARKPEYGAPPSAENAATGPDFSEAPASYED